MSLKACNRLIIYYDKDLLHVVNIAVELEVMIPTLSMPQTNSYG